MCQCVINLAQTEILLKINSIFVVCKKLTQVFIAHIKIDSVFVAL